MTPFKTDAEMVMECVNVQEAIADVIWALIPEHCRDTECDIPGFTDAKNTLLDAVSDRLDDLNIDALTQLDKRDEMQRVSCRGMA